MLTLHARATWLALALAAASGHATAQQAVPYPVKAVRLVVPYPPSGSNDVLSRVAAQSLSAALGQPFLIDNRAGAGGMIGAEHVAKSEPDGYTLLNVQASFATNAAIRTRMPYDTARDFAYLGMMAIGPMLVVVHPSMPAKSVNELVQLLKKRPGALNYGSTGVGGINHLATELFRKMAGISIVHVPYKGVSPALTDLIGGHVQLVITSFPSAYTQVQAGRLRALAIASARRSAFAPNVPTVSESGVPGYIVDLWWGLAVPARTPAAVVERLATELSKALQSDELRQRFAREGAEPTVMPRQAFAAFVAREIARWREVAHDANIKPE